MIVAGTEFSLERYRTEGYSGPIAGLSLEEAEAGYRSFFETLGQSRHRPGPTSANLSAWHHRHRWAYDLATHPRIVQAMRSILGPDIILWAMHFWYKEPRNEKFIPWHQDINYWPMEPEINATAWVSLGFSLTENGCLRVIPGTHELDAEHTSMNDGTSAFGEGLRGDLVDESEAVDVEMSPGQIVFFNERLFHGSNRNASDIPRVAFSVRYTTPEVAFKLDDWGGDKSRIRTFLVSGEDRYRRNDAIRGVVPNE
ncbi:phytanoyl-CoA dioxygenase family protein [Paenibacillus antri]|uniref:Phytanoyl-CoA dioxygenase family protein n=1 Tax=Paenibacillus antri TaxID=2582848 RepID=A0A5R9GGV9_9BACL|nr:phytanoyl-CoA dioxygenase family protein [Paenibacillus antri]TLS52628.1 phytanoyl-CoA dioxygenase family protein [Paenibacillus antri]